MSLLILFEDEDDILEAPDLGDEYQTWCFVVDYDSSVWAFAVEYDDSVWQFDAEFLEC